MIENLSEIDKLGLIIFTVLVVGLLLALVKQPRVPGYLVIGMVLGPHGLGFMAQCLGKLISLVCGDTENLNGSISRRNG